jgi:hypothetical protein
MRGTNTGAFRWAINILQVSASSEKIVETFQLRFGKTFTAKNDSAHGRKIVGAQSSRGQEVNQERRNGKPDRAMRPVYYSDQLPGITRLG